MNSITVVNYISVKNKEPFDEWLQELDIVTRSIIRSRLVRIRLGNFGDCKRIENGHGVWEIRIDYGSGYRIYYGKKGATLVVLLIGGDKRSQQRDIEKAKKYWLEYKEKIV